MTKSYIRLQGTRLQVMRGTAKKTTGGLSKKDLKYNNYGKIVSKKKSNISKKMYGGSVKTNLINNNNAAKKAIKNAAIKAARNLGTGTLKAVGSVGKIQVLQ